jgi:peptide/nickel transport system substrate-binding protein
MSRVRSTLWLLTALSIVMTLLVGCVVPTPAPVETETPAPAVEPAAEAPEAVETEAAEPEIAEEQVLRIGQVGDLRSLEPFREAAPNYLFIMQVFDTMIFNERGEGYKPSAAESWELGPDNMNLTVKLRPDMVTHDGSPVDAEMIKWMFEERITQQDKGVAFYGRFAPYIDQVEVVDPLTVNFVFAKPAPHALDLMAILTIADPDMFTKDDGSVALGNEEDKQIGSGPFKFVEHVPGSHVIYERNEAYWEADAPKLDRIEIRIFGDAASMIAALEAGEIDMAYNPPFEQGARFEGDDRFTAWTPQTNGLAAILMVNPKQEQLRDARVRQAINYAINREAINAAAFGGLGVPTGVPSLPSSVAYTPELEIPTAGDPDAARVLLAEAGAENIDVGITYSASDDTARLQAEVIAANLQEVGINATLDPVEQNIYIDRRVNADFDLLLSVASGYSGHPAGLENSFVYRAEENIFFEGIDPQPEYETYRDAFLQAMSASSEDEAREAWQTALVALKDGAWVDVLVGQPFWMLSTSRLKGVTWTEVDKPVLKYAYFE